MKLQHRVALVTGSAQGIGRAIATALARDGATVVIGDIRLPGAEAAAAALRAEGLAAEAIPLDVGDPAGIEAAFAGIAARHGRLDILVNNAGIASNARFLDTTLSDWERILRVNLTGGFLCAQAAARQMLAQPAGPGPCKIVNIVSISGQRGGMDRAAYGASKAGMDLLTRVMSTELAGQGINVNAIAPGPIATELAAAAHTGGIAEAFMFFTPQHRYGTPEDVARAALFLASADSDYITGHTLNVDGGFGAAGLMYPLPA